MKKENRYVYCTHEPNDCANGRPIVSAEDYGRLIAGWYIHPAPRQDYWRTLIAFQMEQPTLWKLANGLAAPIRESCRFLGFTLWQAFKQRFPQLRVVTGGELELISPRVERVFTNSPVCLCQFRLVSLMKAAVDCVEPLTQEKQVPVSARNLIERTAVTIIEALDQASHLPAPPEGVEGDEAPYPGTPGGQAG